MREASVVVMTSVAPSCLRVLRTEGFIERLRGLIGREALARRHAIWISPCSAVHTFGMRGSIDLVFVDARDRVLRVDAAIAPCRVRFCRDARGVLELSAGAASRFGLDRPAARLAWRGALR